jgi:uncharacterized protein (DUF169 family)
MHSRIAEAINLQTEPVALLLTDDKPADALQFEPGRWGCVMSLFGAAATNGKKAVFDRDTYGCFGGGVGLGFGNTYQQFPGGIDGFSNFLSQGNNGWEEGEQIAEAMATSGARPEFVHHYRHGERYKKDPDHVKMFVDALPQTEIHTHYAAFIPLRDLDPPGNAPESITFLVNTDQYAALVVLANYDRIGLENVVTPYVAACQAVGVFSYREARAPHTRCVTGLVDLSARKYLRSVAGADALTFTIPWRRFLEMEKSVEGSFLEQETWLGLRPAPSK